MAVVFIGDPNEFNVNTQLTNAIPQYQDMFIFAELTAYSRSRTILETSTSGYVGGTTTSSKFANFSGNNDVFTTRWFDDNNSSTLEEGFGMTDIKIKIDSSYIPQVNIKFADVRGMSFFNDINSPYRMLFDFPPPLFELKIKGYYGKTISYKLHLTKYTTEYLSNTGKFVIDANFVAVTFAPLADIPLRYVAQFGYINSDQKTSTPDRTIAPKNTLELIEKIKLIYNHIKDTVNSNTNKSTIDEKQSKIEKLSNGFDFISNISNNLPEFSKGGTIINYVIDNENIDEFNNPKINVIKSISEFNINLSGNTSSNKRLFLGYEPITYNGYDNKLISLDDINNQPKTSAIDDSIARLKSIMVDYSEFGVSESDVKKDVLIYNSVSGGTKYYGIDITKFYSKLYFKYYEIANSRNELISELNTEINKEIYDNLGMLPTIYNIFKVILDDVDHFFDVLRSTSKLAEEHHNSVGVYEKLIGNNVFGDSKTNGRIYAFPLIINKGLNTETRTIPNELSRILGIGKFHEIELVEKFITSFDESKREANIINAKYNKTTDGNNSWMPLTPQDVIDSGGINPFIDANNSFDNAISVILSRYYIMRQNLLNRNFIENSGDTRSLNLFIDLYSKSEAINLYNSLNISSNSNKYSSANIKSNSANYARKISDFYNSLSDGSLPISNNMYVLSNDTSKVNLSLVGVDGTYDMVIDKYNTLYKFKGLSIQSDTPALRLGDGENKSDPINNLISQSKTSWYNFFTSDITAEYFKYTDKNMIYIPDIENEAKEYKSRFICDSRLNLTKHEIDDIINNKLGNYDKYKSYVSTGIPPRLKAIKLKISGDLYDSWHDSIFDNIEQYLTGDNIFAGNIISDMVILSNFGTTVSPFNIMPNFLNKYVFNTPAAISIPKYLSAYIGLLANYTDNDINILKNELIKVDLLEDYGFIFLDYNDVKKYLSEYDKEIFRKEYKNFGTSLGEIYAGIDTLYKNKENYCDKFGTIFNEKLYKDTFINTNIPELLMKKQTLYNYTSLTFKMSDGDKNNPLTYKPLSDENQRDKYCDTFFQTLFIELNRLIESEADKAEKDKSTSNTTTSDIDIMTQTYYSFKNINDKWLSGNANGQGFPYNENGKKLIDQFAFVDRAMNDISDTILNPEVLVDILNSDPNVSVFTALSQLLSLNGFEFFPLQNFIVSSDLESWKDSFRIDVSGEITTKPKFICMYIGGTSSYPTGISDRNGFYDDCIVDLSDKKGAADFNTTGNTGNNNWLSSVKAFKVVVGKQAQSMFKDIKIDSKEYPETNESIQILAKLAGDEKQEVGIPKGQNLYNLYENRSYKATISGMGNASIQPTQYFQVENVPLYNGAYIILTVEHTITPNKMDTDFSGTKILRYPIPRVTQPNAVFGIDIGNSTITNPNLPTTTTPSTSYPNGSGNINSDNDFIAPTRFNSMYSYKMINNGRLSSDGKKFIRNYFNNANSKGNRSLLDWSSNWNYKIPFTNTNPPYNWLKCETYNNNDEWYGALINSIEKHANEYGVDANVVAAMLYNETKFQPWIYTNVSDSSAIGISQFTEPTIFEIILSKNYDNEVKPFTDYEKSLIVNGIDTNLAFDISTYTSPYTDKDKEIRLTLIKNVANNPDLMIKAMCRKLRYDGNNCDNLLSSTIFSYMQGSGFANTNYYDLLNKINNSNVLANGSEYVYKIWNYLGKNNGNNFGEYYKNALFDGGADYSASDKIPNKNFNSDVALSSKAKENKA